MELQQIIEKCKRIAKEVILESCQHVETFDESIQGGHKVYAECFKCETWINFKIHQDKTVSMLSNQAHRNQCRAIDDDKITLYLQNYAHELKNVCPYKHKPPQQEHFYRGLYKNGFRSKRK